MFRRLGSVSGPSRNLLLALVLVVVGGGVVVLNGTRASNRGRSVLETTQASLVPVVPDRAGATPPVAEAATTTTTGPAPAAPASAAATIPGSPSSTVRAVPASTTDSPGAAAPPAASSTTAVTTTSTVAPTTTAPTTTAPATTTTTTTLPAGPSRTPKIEGEVVPLTNADRTAQGLGTLTRNSCLDSVASGYARTMADNGVLAHNPGAGPAVMGCRTNATWGDNVGTAAPCDTGLLEREWMASPSHRKNILTGAFQLIGVGAWTDDAGSCWVQVLFST